ncbi:MAG TPA: MFS transporter [Jatrophihabitantaceae bacterium]|jgi:EmrB/QacA subfamily drug resistance transporter
MTPVSTRPGRTLAVASVAAFMTSLDTMVVTTALPTLRSDLGGSVGTLEWTMNAYYLAFACLLITAAGLGDRFGRRRMLGLGLAVFALASAAAALAPGIGALIAARAVQGGAAAAVLPLTLTVISEAYPAETRGKAIGIWGALLGAGGVLGPLVGGGLLELVGWRAIFWVNVPIALVLAVAAGLAITETFGPRHPLDVAGLVLASTGCLGLSWGLVQSTSHGWGDAAVWMPLLAGVLVLGGFVAREHAARFPMMPTGLFAIRSFSAANGVSFCIYASLAGGVYLMSQFFQIAQHTSPIVAALRFVPWPLPSLLVAPLVGSLATRLGNRPFLVAGMALQTIGMVWFALVVHVSTPYPVLCAPLVLSGIGIAFVFPTVSGEVVSAVPPERMGIAAGVNGSIRELGGVLGVALVATVFAHTGGYASPATFTTGFVHAIWLCAVIAGLGAVSGLLAAPRVPEATPEVAGRVADRIG